MAEQHERRNLAIGHFFNAPFQNACSRWCARIREVFFAWPGVLSCRPSPDFTPALREQLVTDLRWARANGLELDTLFNCNCYGDQAISTDLADFVTRMLGEMNEAGLFPNTVTTTSPFIATVLRERFPSVKIRWSVNQRVHGTVGFESVLELFDSFYVSREHQRDVNYLRTVANWAKAHGKAVGLQANSGCLRQCPFQTFHDNLHGHNRLGQSKAGEQFGFSVFRCKTHYERGNYEDFLRATWVRPEDLARYEPFVSVVKLATRRHPDPVKVLDAYASRHFDGDLKEILDPAHTFPFRFDNTAFSMSPRWPSVRDCPHANNCRHCGNCTELLREIGKNQ